MSAEIEEWDEAGSSFVWVNVPQIDGSSQSDFMWMYYNNTNASDGQDVNGTWDSNFVGVWHLKEDPNVAGSIKASGFVVPTGYADFSGG